VLLAGATGEIGLPEGAQRWLTVAERARADALRKAGDRADFVAAHVLVRLAAARVLGADAAGLTLEQQCPTCGERGHGRPAIAQAPGLQVSLSHTRGYVAAVADTEPVAVDVERLVGDGDLARLDELAAAVLTAYERHVVRTAREPERAFAALWVRKEALIKLGRTDLDSLVGIDATAAGSGYVVFGWDTANVVGVAVSVRPLDRGYMPPEKVSQEAIWPPR